MRHAGQTIQSTTPVFDESQEELEDEKQEELEHYDEMGVPCGRLAVTVDLVPDAMALVGQQTSIAKASAGRAAVLNIQMIMKSLTDVKESIPSLIEELKSKTGE